MPGMEKLILKRGQLSQNKSINSLHFQNPSKLFFKELDKLILQLQ